MNTERKRKLCEAITRKLLEKIGDDLNTLRAGGIGVAIFAFTYDAGAIAYLSTANRDDMIKNIEEWLAYQKAGMTSEPRGRIGDAVAGLRIVRRRYRGEGWYVLGGGRSCGADATRSL